MGYLVCGPVGTGKSFIVQCFAKEIGIPVVELLNFRSKWQGQTEANLERVLGLLDAIGPIAVVVDEADAALGTRETGGADSGVSERVFASLAAFMGDTRRRGKVIWFLMTSRSEAPGAGRRAPGPVPARHHRGARQGVRSAAAAARHRARAGSRCDGVA